MVTALDHKIGHFKCPNTTSDLQVIYFKHFRILCLNQESLVNHLPSGNSTQLLNIAIYSRYLPMKHRDFPVRYVGLPMVAQCISLLSIPK